MYNDLLQNLNYIEGLYIYGSGEMGQLSPLKETTKEKKGIFQTSVPKKIPIHFIRNTETIKLVQCGTFYTLILSTEGNVYTFGCADDGTLGHEESMSARRVPLKFPATGISGGDCHGIAYNRDNLAFWGRFRNKNGGLGKICYDPTYFNNSHINREYYKKAISGANHVIILSEKKNVFAFGNNDSGQIAVSPGKVFHHFQMNKLYEKNVEDIFTGDEYSFLTKYENGKKILKSWGANSKGQLGIGSYQTNVRENSSVYVPTKVIFPGISNISIKKVTGGAGTSICLTEDNRVFVWGLNDFSQLGLKIKDKIIPRPKEIEFFNPYSNPNNIVDEIYACNQYFYAKNNTTNKVYSWGMGDSYKLGNRKEKSELSPYLINNLFFKNLYISDLALGSTHVVVFLKKEKKEINLNMNMSPQKRIEKKKNEISDIIKNKPIKRIQDDLYDEKKEKEVDFGIVIRVKEEYITLHESDKPKASVKKFVTEKKIIKKDNNKDNIYKNIEEENEKMKKIGNMNYNENQFKIVIESQFKNENKRSTERSVNSSAQKTKSSPKKEIEKDEKYIKEVETTEEIRKTSLKDSLRINNSGSGKSKEEGKKEECQKKEINEEKDKIKNRNQPKDIKESCPENQNNTIENRKEITPSKNSNKKKSVIKNEKDNNTNRKENVEKDRNEKESISRSRRKISSSKEKGRYEEKDNKIEDKKGINTKKQIKTKNANYRKEEDNDYMDSNDGKDKEEKKTKKILSQSKNNKNTKKEKKEENGEANNFQRNSENNNNNSRRKNSNSNYKYAKSPMKKEDSKNKGKKSGENSKKKTKSKSKDKYHKRK